MLEGRAVGKIERTTDIALDGRLVGREREEQLVEVTHMLTGLDGAVLREVLRKSEHQGLALVQNVDLLPLSLREHIRPPHGITRQQGTCAEERDAEEPDMPEGTLDIGQ